MGSVDFLPGRRRANREYVERKIGAFEGVPAMGLDGLGSSAVIPNNNMKPFKGVPDESVRARIIAFLNANS